MILLKVDEKAWRPKKDFRDYLNKENIEIAQKIKVMVQLLKWVQIILKNILTPMF